MKLSGYLRAYPGKRLTRLPRNSRRGPAEVFGRDGVAFALAVFGELAEEMAHGCGAGLHGAKRGGHADLDDLVDDHDGSFDRFLSYR